MLVHPQLRKWKAMMENEEMSRQAKDVTPGLQIYGGPGSLSHDFKIWPITFQGSGPS